MLTDGCTDGRTHGRTDARTDDGQKVITIAHPEQSSGELKKTLSGVMEVYGKISFSKGIMICQTIEL